MASVVVFLGWGDRSASTEHALATSEVLVVNVAGPVTVTGSATVTGATVRVDESWLFGRPEVTVEVSDGRTVVRARCPGRGPCRAAVDVEMGAGSELVVVASDAVTVRRFDGSLSALSAEGDVSFGPVSGSVRAVAAGRIGGWGLLVDEADLSAGQAIDLTFVAAPGSVVVDGAGDVSVALPDDDYLVVTEAGGSVISDLDHDEAAASQLVITAGGDVVLSSE